MLVWFTSNIENTLNAWLCSNRLYFNISQTNYEGWLEVQPGKQRAERVLPVNSEQRCFMRCEPDMWTAITKTSRRQNKKGFGKQPPPCPLTLHHVLPESLHPCSLQNILKHFIFTCTYGKTGKVLAILMYKQS